MFACSFIDVRQSAVDLTAVVYASMIALII
jgi:hypothetical protein